MRYLHNCVALLGCLTVGGLIQGAPEPGGASQQSELGVHELQFHPPRDGEVCSFCHTPRTEPPARPAWIALRPAGEFAAFDSLAGGGPVTPGGTSVACLTCHDGSQAPDIAANTPATIVPGAPPLVRRPMTRDHPVGILYSGFGKPAQRERKGQPPVQRLQRDTINGEIKWWLDTEPVPNGVRDKTDVIFYTRGEGAAAQPFIECASCHDPHANPGTLFLRRPPDGRSLCRTCHNL